MHVKALTITLLAIAPRLLSAATTGPVLTSDDVSSSCQDQCAAAVERSGDCDRTSKSDDAYAQCVCNEARGARDNIAGCTSCLCSAGKPENNAGDIMQLCGWHLGDNPRDDNRTSTTEEPTTTEDVTMTGEATISEDTSTPSITLVSTPTADDTTTSPSATTTSAEGGAPPPVTAGAGPLLAGLMMAIPALL
ncbi:hypothetical protein HD806DRAFT_531668 [Xylariaceae sp. AK1471]|nr:hypothetical protein HD806DRAFT_531668 [Xylariaceae sp. AK1471]